MKESNIREYFRYAAAVFCKTKERYGGLSNMAGGYPLRVNGVFIHTSEALYQACRFPHMPEIQRLIISQASPMTAKMKSKPYRKNSRFDWNAIRINVMRWCLRVKLAQNWVQFGELLLSTGDKAIVEESRKDDFWGAKPIDEVHLVGANILGRLLMELREDFKHNDSDRLKYVPPLNIPDFLLYNEPIGPINLALRRIEKQHDLMSNDSDQVADYLPSNDTMDKPPIENKPAPAKESNSVSEAMNITRKKLIEVALPLEAINIASAREKSIRHGHPSTLHLWWARRPLAAARAVLFAQMVDDPSSRPELFPTEAAQEVERERLFAIIRELVKWESTTNEVVLEAARAEIRRSWRLTCEDNKDHPQAAELFDPDKLPAFHDPFAGGGSIPLEAQRLGLEAYASDLNPVAVLINKAMIEIPPKFAGRPPVNPKSRSEKTLHGRVWRGAQGLAEDVRYYGQWMRDEAFKRIGHLYPQIEITAEMVAERPDLKAYQGRKLTVIAWLWARTVRSPNPAFADVHVPLASTFMLSTKAGKEAYVEPVIEGNGYRFTVKVGKPRDPEGAKNGTRAGKAQDFMCLISGVPIARSYIRDEGKDGKLGSTLMAIVAEGDRGRVYLPPLKEHTITASSASDFEIVEESRNSFLSIKTPTRAMITGGVCSAYGLTTFGDLFTPRQLVALNTFSDLVLEAREKVIADASAAGMTDDGQGLEAGGAGTMAYGEAVAVYLGFTVSRQTNRGCTISFWDNTSQKIQQAFGRQALPMTWDFCEANFFSNSSGNWLGQLQFPVECIEASCSCRSGCAVLNDAKFQIISSNKIVSTDPPYYDNIGYANLSDFFYAWLRRSLKPFFHNLFTTLETPKIDELVATSYNHGGKQSADKFFLRGMTDAMHCLALQANSSFPVTIYYAFKQSETDKKGETTSTGWETFLDALIRAGFELSGTWPMRTELTGNLKKNVAALASSIILVCRKLPDNSPTATRREFLNALKRELPEALRHLQKGNIAPVDLAQAAIGPGMGVFTRYTQVLEADGSAMGVRTALALINQTLDEVLAEQEGDFDADSRWAVTWFDQFGFAEADFGQAENLSKAKNTSVEGLAQAGILVSKAGKVRLLRPEELPDDWDPANDSRLTVWEMVHHLIRVLDKGESEAASMVRKLGGKADAARELAYRLYTLCERKKRAQEAMAYNGLVTSWPEIVRLAREGGAPQPRQGQGSLLDME